LGLKRSGSACISPTSLSRFTCCHQTSMHFYGWKRGLKTGMYYLRTKPAANAIQFTVDSQPVLQKRRKSGGRKGAVGEMGSSEAGVAGGKEDSEEDGEDEDENGGTAGACGDDVCLSCQG